MSSEPVRDAELRADGGSALLAAAHREVGIEHEVLLHGANAEGALNGICVDDVHVNAAQRYLLVAEGRTQAILKDGATVQPAALASPA